MLYTLGKAALTVTGLAVGANYGGPITTPPAAAYKIEDTMLAELTPDDRALALRYFAGNARWDVIRERGGYFAIRKEREETTLNGFYGDFSGGGTFQTRVLVSFGKAYGFGQERGNITRVTVASGAAVATRLEGPHDGSPGNSSYTIFTGSVLGLEIYEQTDPVERAFTQKAFAEVSAELREMVRHREEIERDGRMSAPEYYFKTPVPAAPELVVGDGMQPGIFQVKAWANPGEAGDLYLKVHDTRTGARLSAERLTPRSTRLAGWSADTKTLFPYSSEVTVYEGDWDHEYEARFELWFRPKTGTERKLLEQTRPIHGWQR